MAPLPESNTKRYWGVYTVESDEHRVLMRTTPEAEDAAAIAKMRQFFAALAPSLATDVVFLSMEVAELGSDVRNPLDIGAPIVGTAAGTITPVQTPREWTIKGRSRDGRRVGVSIFGVQAQTPDTWDQAPIAVSGLSAARILMIQNDEFFRSISGLKPVWYDRVTVNYNDAWVKNRQQS